MKKLATLMLMAGAGLLGTSHAHAAGQRDKQQGAQKQTMQQSQEQQLRGRVQKVETIRTKGKGVNQVVMLQTEDGQSIAVDLGPSSDLVKVTVKEGSPLTAKGTVVSVGGHPVFMASQYQVNGTTADVKRKSPSKKDQLQTKQMKGTLQKLRQVGVKGGMSDHHVAIIQSNGRNLYADLGPVSQLQPLSLKVGDRVNIEGFPMHVKGRTIFVAQTVESGNHQIAIDRRAVAVQKFPVAGQDGGETQPQRQTTEGVDEGATEQGAEKDDGFVEDVFDEPGGVTQGKEDKERGFFKDIFDEPGGVTQGDDED